MARLDDQLTRLATLSPADLHAEWQREFGVEAPELAPSLLRRALAHRLQERTLGGLSTGTLRMLRAAASDQPLAPEIRLKPGTRLLREWNGTTHSVLVTDDGLLFGERRYASLSQIAKEITGAHWSGPRFFGLKRRVNPPARGEAANG